MQTNVGGGQVETANLRIGTGACVFKMPMRMAVERQGEPHNYYKCISEGRVTCGKSTSIAGMDICKFSPALENIRK